MTFSARKSNTVGVAEKTGDVDQQILGQKIELVGIVAQHLQIKLHVVGFERHPAFDPALQRALLVQSEIVRRPCAQQVDDLRQPVPRRFPSRRMSRRARIIFENRFGNFRRRQHVIDRPGQNGVARHAVIAGLFGVLRDDQPAFFLDRLQPGAAVGAGPRKHDANRAGGKFLGQRMQQEIERQPRAVTLLRLRQPQGAGLDREIRPRRNDIEMLALDLHAVRRLADFHRRMAGQQLDQHAFMGRIEVLDQNEGEAGAGGQRVQKHPARVEPPG